MRAMRFMNMDENSHPTGKISVHGDGMGAPTPELIERRAREIAMIDEREPNDYTDADWDQARRELMGAPTDSAPEDLGVEISADEHEMIPESIAHRAPRSASADDESIGETLVSGGLEEAAHDQMLEARIEEREQENN